MQRTDLFKVLSTVLWLFAQPGAMPAAVHETISSFQNAPRCANGNLVIGPDGYYWGTTLSGGSYDLGTIYKVKPDGTNWAIVISFTGNSAINKGAQPYAGLLNDGSGWLWGTTSSGALGYGYGTVFKINALNGQLTTVVEFTNNGAVNKGRSPKAALVSDDSGNFWGTTSQGGTADYGTVFKLNPITGALTTMVHFLNNGATKGSYPRDKLTSDGNGYLWGATPTGGVIDEGTIFKINTTTGVLTTVVDFNNFRTTPNGSLLNDGSGFLWGTTVYGGAQVGSVFKINIASNVLTTVANLTGVGGFSTSPEPSYALPGLVKVGNEVIGVSHRGGASQTGTIFKVDATSGLLTKLVDFPAGSSPSGHLVIGANGFVWGASDTGVFKTRTLGSFTTVAEFAKPLTNKGSYPSSESGLVSDGVSLWGTTEQGGTSRGGTIFKINEATRLRTTMLEIVGNGRSDSSGTYSKLIDDGSGSFWVAHPMGGGSGFGSIFKINATTGASSSILEFGGANVGDGPNRIFVNDGNGFLWGTTTAGGTSRFGTVFKISIASGSLTTLASFNGSAGPIAGAYPVGGLTNTEDGFFWGSTSQGGVNGTGTIFKINASSGAVITVASFASNSVPNAASNPITELVNDGLGFLWGTSSERTPAGNNEGAIFKINLTTGILTTVAVFDPSAGFGFAPEGGLVSNGHGLLWGTNAWGGNNGGMGTVYRVDAASGIVTKVLNFTGIGMQANNGSRPGSLLLHPDGNLYGTTSGGGPGGAGTVFRLRLGPSAVTLPAASMLDPRLVGTVNPNSVDTVAYFEYGTSPAALINTTTSQNFPATSIEANITALIPAAVPGTTYYYRLRAENAERYEPTRGAVLSYTFQTLTFPQWTSALALSPETSAAQADADSDGVSNLVEYALGLDPTKSDSHKLPAVEFNNGTLSLSFTQPPGVIGVTYGVEWSATMTANSWTSVPDTGSSGTHTFQLPIISHPRVFFRQVISIP